jgi:hypothetical protein
MILQQRQIVVKGLGKQKDIEYPEGKKYVIISFHSITWIFIIVDVTIYRTIASPESYENSHYIMTTGPRSCI